MKKQFLNIQIGSKGKKLHETQFILDEKESIVRFYEGGFVIKTERKNKTSIQPKEIINKKRIDLYSKLMLCYTLLTKRILYTKNIKYKFCKKSGVVEYQSYPLFDVKKIDFKSNENIGKRVDEFINASQNDSKFLSTLYINYISSKIKQDKDSKRIIYQWMCFNTLYGKAAKDRFSGNNRDKANLDKIFGKLENNNIEVSLKQRNRVFKKLIMGEYAGEDLSKYIQKTLQNDRELHIISSPEHFALIHLNYAFRCSYMHGNAPLMFYSFGNETELKLLNYSNNLLSNFLDKYVFDYNQFLEDFYVKTN